MITEIQNLLNTYTPSTTHLPTHQRLSAIPMSAWEDEMPITESVIRETLRLVSCLTALRRNIADDLRIGEKGVGIDKGAFLAYNLGDVHMSEKYYPDAHKFDPDRFGFVNGNEPGGNVPFLGWGSGRHTCSGQPLFLSFLSLVPSNLLRRLVPGIKIAKFEIKMILALFLTSFEYELVDAFGNPPKGLPRPDWNDIQQVCQTPFKPFFCMLNTGLCCAASTGGGTVFPSV
jgi:hypothetical protein